MLETLYVKDFAIVGEAEIVFGPGMTVVTGETGAGKSLLVDALLLLAGCVSQQKYDTLDTQYQQLNRTMSADLRLPCSAAGSGSA